MWLFGKRNERLLAGRLCSVVSREEWICHCCHHYLILWENASFFPPNNSDIKVLWGSFYGSACRKCPYCLTDISERGVLRNHTCLRDRSTLCKAQKTTWRETSVFSQSEFQALSCHIMSSVRVRKPFVGNDAFLKSCQ